MGTEEKGTEESKLRILPDFCSGRLPRRTMRLMKRARNPAATIAQSHNCLIACLIFKNRSGLICISILIRYAHPRLKSGATLTNSLILILYFLRRGSERMRAHARKNISPQYVVA